MVLLNVPILLLLPTCVVLSTPAVFAVSVVVGPPIAAVPQKLYVFWVFCNLCISFVILTSMYHFIKRCSCCSCCSWCNWCSCSNSCCYYCSFCFYSAPVPVAPAVPAAVLVPVSRHVHAVPTGFLSRKYLKGKLGMPWEVS